METLDRPRFRNARTGRPVPFRRPEKQEELREMGEMAREAVMVAREWRRIRQWWCRLRKARNRI
jgi:hypothetical protein